MIWKNKKKTFAIKADCLISNDYGKMVKILPCIDFWWGDNFCIGISWLFFSSEFWFGDVSDLC